MVEIDAERSGPDRPPDVESNRIDVLSIMSEQSRRRFASTGLVTTDLDLRVTVPTEVLRTPFRQRTLDLADQHRALARSASRVVARLTAASHTTRQPLSLEIVPFPPTDHEGWPQALNQGLTELEAGRPDHAEHHLQDAAGYGEPRAMLELAQLAQARGDHDIAINWLQRAATSGNSDALVSLGVLALERAELEEGERLLIKAAAAGSPVAMLHLAGLSRSRGDEPAASGWLARAAAAARKVVADERLEDS